MKYKAFALKPANVKSSSGNIEATMQIGDSVIADLSTAKTDLVNFNSFTRASGSTFYLPTFCKVSLANLSSPVPVSDGTPIPIPTPVASMTVSLVDNDTGESWLGSMTKQ